MDNKRKEEDLLCVSVILIQVHLKKIEYGEKVFFLVTYFKR